MFPEFHDKKLLTQALTHPSAGRQREKSAFERLEFLGDRVLGIVIAEVLYKKFPQKQEGLLAKEFARLVRKETCKSVFIQMGLHTQIKANAKEMEVPTSHILSDACEAFLGALFLDQGFDVARSFILNAWSAYIDGKKETLGDEKSTLQEYVQKRFKTTPVYSLIEKTGSEHEPTFMISVTMPNSPVIYGSGPTRRLAEKHAAKNMLIYLKILPE